MRKRTLLAVLLCACAGPRPITPRGGVVLTVDGDVEGGPFPFGAEDVPGLPRRAFRALPPGAGRAARFEGVAVVPLLADHVSLDRGVDLAIFHGEGGVVAPVPFGALRQMRPVLADAVDGAPVGRWRSEAAPLQLAWPNLEQPGIDGDPRMRGWWLRGVRRIELRSWAATYARALRVPPGSGDDARRGSAQVLASCLGCHRLRGVGGTRGRDLRALVGSVGEEALLARLAAHAQALQGEGAGPAPGEGALRQAAAFLVAVGEAGGPADEELPVREAPEPEAPPPVPQGP